LAKENTTLDASAAIRTADEYRDLIAAYRNGMPIPLSEIANVIDDVETQSNANYYNDLKTIGLAIFKQADGNTVKIVDPVSERLESPRPQIPPSVEMWLTNDRSVSSRNSVRAVQTTLAIAAALVVLVISRFRRSGAATIIPALAVPVSLIATC